ncbi:MAG: pentapeptide repeat-containing protein [Thermodesulfobacteriota bacterium]
MANESHARKLLEGVEAWNEWRASNEEKPDLGGTDFTSDEFQRSPLFNQEGPGEEPVVDLTHVNLQGAILAGANLQGVGLWNANLQGANLAAANLENAKLAGANLQDADLTRTNLRRTNFADANLQGASLWHADLHEACLWDANLRQANLSDANLQAASLWDANLQGATLWDANLQAAPLWNADLEGANLTAANLQGASLAEANLQGANLQGANLREAVLTGANLSGADLSSANLEEANVARVEFSRDSRQRGYRGIRVGTCYGSQMFKRFAQDQDYIEEFRSSLWGSVLFWPWYIVADCGRSFLRWAFWCFAMTIAFASIYYWMGNEHFRVGELGFSWTTMMYYSVTTFTTLGYADIKPITETAAKVVVMEVLLGYLMLAGLISILANKVARRG